MIVAVIGKNFGDEGKGLATDYFCGRACKSVSTEDSGKMNTCIVIKHNGGAQAGHTVIYQGKRFVFHQLSSGSFRGADTYFADTYYPDLYKLGEEVADFSELCFGHLDGVQQKENRSQRIPRIYSNAETPLTVIDDVILNMISEKLRGANRHGSCGMGINEAYLRTKAGYGITMKEACDEDAGKLAERMVQIRTEYVIPRVREMVQSTLGFDKTEIRFDSKQIPENDVSEIREYIKLFHSVEVIRNAAEEMARNTKYVTVVENEEKFLRGFRDIIFETGQGLLLDSENEEYAPHVTASRTGLCNIVKLLKKNHLELDEACYITRSYVTRHGAGRLVFERKPEEVGEIRTDLTNVFNPWQENIRYAPHENPERFCGPVLEDLKFLKQGNENSHSDSGNHEKTRVSVFVTHLNETNHEIVFADRSIPFREFILIPKVSDLFEKLYVSDSENGDDTETIQIR